MDYESLAKLTLAIGLLLFIVALVIDGLNRGD